MASSGRHPGGRPLPGRGGRKRNTKEESLNLRRLVTLARRLDERHLEVLVRVAQVMRR